MSGTEPLTPATATPFQVLQFRVATAHWRWKTWQQLFLGDPKHPREAEARVALMNSIAPAFFQMLKEMLLQDVVMSICKLVDEAEGGPSNARRRNLSLEAVLEDESNRLSTSARKEAVRLVGEFREDSKPLIAWRHWRIAHEDYNVATGKESLPPLPDIGRALATAVQIMELLDPDAATCTYGYAQMIGQGDGDSLVFAMRCAAQYVKECVAKGVPALPETDPT